MGLRELKETAHAQYIRGKFEQCAQTYQQILKLAPRDPNMHVRHAEACRRAGARQQAITSYRMAANLLLAVGCESRARGALKAALELEPRDTALLTELARLGPSGSLATFSLEPERPVPDGAPGPLPSQGPAAGPVRSMTSTGMVAPGRPVTATPVRSMTSTGMAAPGRPVTAAPVRSMTSTGMAAPGRPMPSAPAVATGRSVTPPAHVAPSPAPTQLALPPAPEVASRGTPPPARPAGAAQDARRAPQRTPSPAPSAARSPAGAVASGSAATPVPLPTSEQRVKLQVEVRRLSDRAVAFRLSPQSRWVLFTSASAIQVRRVDSLPELPDFTLDITVDEDARH